MCTGNHSVYQNTTTITVIVCLGKLWPLGVKKIRERFRSVSGVSDNDIRNLLLETTHKEFICKNRKLSHVFYCVINKLKVLRNSL